MSVSPSIASGALVPADSCCCQTIWPVLRFIAISLPLNVVVNTRSLVTVAAPYGLDGSFVFHITLPVLRFNASKLPVPVVKRADLLERRTAVFALTSFAHRLLAAAYTMPPAIAICVSTPP